VLSRNIQSALAREVIGQPRAIHALTRSLTVSIGGLAPAALPAGIHLLLGPSGTGKTHTARALARLLHGEGRGLAVIDCNQLIGGDELGAITRQLAPCFQAVGREEGSRALPARSIVLVEHLEAATRETVEALLGMLETGSIPFADGNHANLAGSLVLLTSNLCAREIYGEDRKEIGFSPAAADLEDSEKARIFQLCVSSVEKRWGSMLLGHIDDLTVFHRLRGHHMPLILARQVDELNRTLAGRLSVELDQGAREFLVMRGSRWPQHGAWYLVKVFRRFVVFPIADLLAGGDRPSSRRVRVELDGGDRFRFTVTEASVAPSLTATTRAVPISWSEPVTV
jgi:ATP-dependent Clp protease ATP-binding subunit ClpB